MNVKLTGEQPEAGLELAPEMMKQVLGFQAAEATGHRVYQALARIVASEGNRTTLEEMAAEELGHYEAWKRYTEKDVPASRWTVGLYRVMAHIMGFTFTAKLLERGEQAAQSGYAGLVQVIPEAAGMLQDEDHHEEALLAMLDEERLRYTGSMVLGLSDALVELTGTLAGLTLALQNTQLIALSVSITGIAAALSMSASEYLSTKADAGERRPVKAALYTGAAYVFAVLLLILPYLLLGNYYVCLVVSLSLAILAIAGFSAYIAVARDESFGRRFLEMSGLTLGVAGLSFLIGLLVRKLFGIEV